MLYKNAFPTEHLQTTASEFLQKDNDKFKKMSDKRKYKKDSEKRKSWNRGKVTQMPITTTEDLAATDKS